MSKQPLIAPIEIIALKFGIQILVYFGSYQTEYYHQESDIDLAFLAKTPLKSEHKLQLLEELILFHRKSEIDLVDLRTAEPLLRYEIAKNGRILYEREPGLFERYRLFYIKQSYELQPVFEVELQNIRAAIREVTDHG
jgi:predicted nucleotidyltransferase